MLFFVGGTFVGGGGGGGEKMVTPVFGRCVWGDSRFAAVGFWADPI